MAESGVSSAPTSSSGFGIRQYFRRSPSQSPPSSKGANRPAETATVQKRVDLEPQHLSERARRPKQRQMQRSSVFGCCAQSVGTVASVLFSVINRSGGYDETARDSAVTRQAKILYVALLESVQKERGEWQGFSSTDPNNNAPEDDVLSPRDLLTTSIAAGDKTFAEQLGVLNELLEVSFRNLMGPLVPLELYTQHKKMLLRESLAVPPALTTLLAIKGILDQLEREVRHCLLRLLALWDLVALVGGDSQPLLKTIADKHHHVFSESSEFESMTARKSERHDRVAINLLQIMVLYRDILFSDIEFILTKQELQINARLVDEARARGWPPDLEPAAPSEEEDDYYSDGDVSSISSSDGNQLLHDDRHAELQWGQDAALGPPLLLRTRSRASSSVPSVHEDHVDDEYQCDYEGEDEDGEWSIPSPSLYNSRRHRHDKSPPVSGGAGPLVPVPMVPSSSEGIPPPDKAGFMSPQRRPLERVSSGRRHSQQSFTSTPDSPTHSAISQASSNRSSTRRLKLRTKQRSSASISSMNGRSEQRRQENHWHDTTSNESRSPRPPSRSSMRRNSSKRVRGSRSGSSRRRSSQPTDQQADAARRPHRNEIQAKPKQSFLEFAASCLTVPTVAAATLCVLATMATVALWQARNKPRH